MPSTKLPKPVRPKKSAKNGGYVNNVWWLRKRVPTHLRDLVGSGEVWRSLETPDERVANQRIGGAVAKLEAEWEALSTAATQSAALARRRIDAVGRPVLELLVSQRELQALRRQAHETLAEAGTRNPVRRTGFDALRVGARADEEALKRQAWDLLQNSGHDFTDDDVERLAPMLIAAHLGAAADAQRAARDDFTPNPILAKLPQLTAPELDLVRAFEEYAEKGGLKGGTDGPTAKRWRPKIKLFVKWLGHRDLSRMTPDDAYSWVDHLLLEGYSAKSVKDVWVASLSSVAGFMTYRRKLKTANPFKSIVVRPLPKSRKPEDPNSQPEVTLAPRQKGYSNGEAIRILEATFLPASPLTAVETRAARRWLPWLCAYSGARVNELTSLYPADVSRDPASGIWVMIIKPELEKTEQWRTVPIHSHVVEQGFLEYVESRRKAKLPLFYDPSRSRGAKAGNPQFKKVAERLAEWLHTLKLVPPGVQPSHAWRHLFKSTARHVGMDREVEGFITGHRPKDSNASSDYGDKWVATMSAEIERYPRFGVTGAGVTARKKTRRTSDQIAADDAAKAARKASLPTRAASVDASA